MIQELLKAFIVIFIAEMGDKTQILAMAFATKFPVKKVLLGIFLGSLLNHGLAVLFGNYISSIIPNYKIQIVAGFAFVCFALWTLKIDDNDEDETTNPRFKVCPSLTVALAFFIGELGDKTQLTAITLATLSKHPLITLTGTVLGMIVTGGMGIIIGKKMGDKIPEYVIKIIASTAFMLCGVTKLYYNIPINYLNPFNISLFSVTIICIVSILVRRIVISKFSNHQSLYRKTAKDLYNYYHGFFLSYFKKLFNINHQSEINEDLVIDSLKMTLIIIKKDYYNIENNNIHEIRRNLEKILFGESIEKMNDWMEYTKCLKCIDEVTASKITSSID
jgi:putative Ca2+/H+ antiporter (TMEM165/GDT1 family)